MERHEEKTLYLGGAQKYREDGEKAQEAKSKKHPFKSPGRITRPENTRPYKSHGKHFFLIGEGSPKGNLRRKTKKQVFEKE